MSQKKYSDKTAGSTSYSVLLLNVLLLLQQSSEGLYIILCKYW